MRVSTAFLAQWNNQRFQFQLTNGNISDPQINLNVQYSASDNTIRGEVQGKVLIETQSLTDFSTAVDELFALTHAAFIKRVADAPAFQRV